MKATGSENEQYRSNITDTVEPASGGMPLTFGSKRIQANNFENCFTPNHHFLLIAHRTESANTVAHAKRKTANGPFKSNSLFAASSPVFASDSLIYVRFILRQSGSPSVSTCLTVLRS